MSDEIDIKQLRVDRSLEKRRAIKDMELLLTHYGLDTFDKTEWSFFEILAHDIEADYAAKNERLVAAELLRQIERQIKEKYQEYPDFVEKAIPCLPSIQMVLKWRKKKKWQEAVWSKCKETGLFTNDKRALLIKSLFDKAIEKGDVQAAKTWLILSGDYVEKAEVKTDKTQDIFRQINEQLHKKKEE